MSRHNKYQNLRADLGAGVAGLTTALPWLLLIIMMVIAYTTADADKQSPSDDGRPIVLAYVEENRKALPDPSLMSHIIYAFGVFGDDNDEAVIQKPERLAAIAALRDSNPELKVILGIGGYKKEGFSEMAADPGKRKSFVRSVKKIIRKYRLDGVDLDWEFPTTTAGGHTARPDDAVNYTYLVRDLRKALGKKAWISLYSNNSAAWIDFVPMIPYLTFVNASGYNIKPMPGHQSNLYPSEKCGEWCVAKSMEAHIRKGIPRDKLLLGVPFFGRGSEPFRSYTECRQFGWLDKGTHIVWDEDAHAPYYADPEGNLVLGFDNGRSLTDKWEFMKQNGLGGVFYWNYDGDYPDHRLAKTLNDLRSR